jgi:plasmid stabilization system protein ParE
MNFIIKWSDLSKVSYRDEIDFILLKWNVSEVQKFILLVDNHLKKMVLHPEIGKINKRKKIYCLVISEQTSLYYRINKSQKQIELILFWNNKKDPKLLRKLL